MGRRLSRWSRPRLPVGAGAVAEHAAGARHERHLAAIFGFYEHHARSGVKVAAGLVSWRRIGRGSYKPFLHHVTGGRPIATRPVKLPIPQRAPRTLSPEQLVHVLAAPVRARDRFLLALLAETGMRVGQALGLRHADFVSRAKEVRIVPRADNANGARAKLAPSRSGQHQRCLCQTSRAGWPKAGRSTSSTVGRFFTHATTPQDGQPAFTVRSSTCTTTLVAVSSTPSTVTAGKPTSSSHMRVGSVSTRGSPELDDLRQPSSSQGPCAASGMLPTQLGPLRSEAPDYATAS